MDTAEERLAEVWTQIDQVMDPELDQSVRALGFVAEVATTGLDVRLVLRLPTYWCSPNFTYMMMQDLRDVVSRLPWVQSVELQLQDHESQAVLNRGIARHETFQDMFPDATGDLAELRQIFKEKAFYGRQKHLLERLMARGVTVSEWAPGRWKEVRFLAHGSDEDQTAFHRYQDIVRYWNLPQADEDPVVVRLNHKAVTPQGWLRYWHELRLVSLNMEASAHICRGLLAVRYAPAAMSSTRVP